MREIRFKAKRLDNGEWVYGFPLHSIRQDKDAQVIIYPTAGAGGHLVDPDTVCQFTGLKDHTDEDIYDGDILHSDNWACLCVVEWHDGGFILAQGERSNTIGHEIESHLDRYENDIAVIGNIHDNPELLEEINQ